MMKTPTTLPTANRHPSSKKWLWWLRGVAVVLAVAIAIIVGAFMTRRQPLVPPAIHQQVTSTIVLPGEGRGAIDRDSFQYDSSKKLLTYNVAYANTTIVMSEQPAPDSFTDIPEVYAKFTQDLHPYLSFQGNLGMVYVSRFKDQHNQQVAVMSASGTLLFAKASKDISNSQWRQYFQTMRTDN